MVVVGYGRCSLFMHSFLLGYGMAGRRCNRVNKNKQGHAMRRVSRTPFVHKKKKKKKTKKKKKKKKKKKIKKKKKNKKLDFIKKKNFFLLKNPTFSFFCCF
jgi:homoserine dehydrogenase